MGTNYHITRNKNLYANVYDLARSWSEIRDSNPGMLKGWGKIISPAEVYKLFMLLDILLGKTPKDPPH